MHKGTYEYQSEFARKYVAQGREEGLKEGREEGLQKGREEGEREALFEVLNARGLKVQEAERQRIESCTDLMQLKRWLRLAVSVRATEELFKL